MPNHFNERRTPNPLRHRWIRFATFMARYGAEGEDLMRFIKNIVKYISPILLTYQNILPSKP